MGLVCEKMLHAVRANTCATKKPHIDSIACQASLFVDQLGRPRKAEKDSNEVTHANEEDC